MEYATLETQDDFDHGITGGIPHYINKLEVRDSLDEAMIGLDELELIEHYANVFGKGKKYHYIIFSLGGFTDELKAVAKERRIRLVTLSEMYQD